MNKKTIISVIIISTILTPIIALGALPVCRVEQGCVGQDSSSWTGVVYTSSGVWSASTTLSLVNLTVTASTTLQDLSVAGAFLLGGQVGSGGIDMNNNLITNIGDANTDFTSGGGLNVVGAVAVGTTTAQGVFTVGTSTGDAIMNITTGGFVGIGTSSPGAQLEIKGSGATAATFSLEVRNSSGDSILEARDDKFVISPIFYSSNSGAYIGYSDSKNYLRADTLFGSSDNSILASSGYVGIGTTTIAGLFTVGTTSDAIFNITTEGNVGIGTASPGTKLDVLSGTANTSGDSIQGSVVKITGPDVVVGVVGNNGGLLNIDTNDALGIDIGGSIGFGGRYTGTAQAQWAVIKAGKANATDGNYSGYLAFSTRNSGSVVAERMRIDTVGNVGIGTTTPSALLHAYTSATTTAILEQTGPNDILYAINATGTVLTIDNAGNLILGNSSMNNPSKLCFWNGADYTSMSFGASSITPIYTTSTIACQ